MVEDPLVLVVVEEAVGVDHLQESLATLGRDYEKNTGTSMNFQSFRRTFTRNIQILVADHL